MYGTAPKVLPVLVQRYKVQDRYYYVMRVLNQISTLALAGDCGGTSGRLGWATEGSELKR